MHYDFYGLFDTLKIFMVGLKHILKVSLMHYDF